MKKLISALLAVTLLCALLVVPVSAVTDPLAEKFQDQLRLLDHFYEYDKYYMIRIASDYFVDFDNMGPVTVSAAEFEEKLAAHFALDDAQLAAIRNHREEDYFSYDVDAQTYTLRWVGGFGGMMPEREYWGYVKNGKTYDVYYHKINYSFLADVLPEGTTVDDLLGPLDYPMEYEYNGVVYEYGMDGYVATVGYENSGKKYTVEMNGDIVRIISVSKFTPAEAPKKFHVPVIYDVPKDNSVSFPENECFEGNTTVKVKKVSGKALQTVQAAVEKVAQKFVAYEFTATKDGAAVQPNGTLAVTFAIPAGYSNNVKVYYLAAKGKLELQSTAVNTAKRTVTVQLTHFSTYVLVDADTAPTTAPTTVPTTVPTTEPTTAPTTEPTTMPTTQPTTAPTTVPTTSAPTQPPQFDNSLPTAGVIIAVIAIVAAVASGVVIVLLVRKKKDLS